MSRIKMVSGDGGGVRGIIQAALLNSVDTSGVTAWAATSVFSFIASIHAANLWASDPQQRFRYLYKVAPFIFKRNWWDLLHPTRTIYSGHNVEAVMKPILSLRFGDIKTPMFIPTVDFIHGEKPKVYDNVDPRDDMELPVYEVCMRSSAAPPYFPPRHGFLDGGFWANDPTMVGVHALRHKLGCDYQDIDVFSIPSGVDRPVMHRELTVLTWSKLKWIKMLAKYITKGNLANTSFFAKTCGLHYYDRVDFPINREEYSFDSINQVSFMLADTSKYVDEFRRRWDKFMSA